MTKLAKRQEMKEGNFRKRQKAKRNLEEQEK
jgi:hypothetical protein